MVQTMSRFILPLPLQDDKKHGSMGDVKLAEVSKDLAAQVKTIVFCFGLERLFDGN